MNSNRVYIRHQHGCTSTSDTKRVCTDICICRIITSCLTSRRVCVGEHLGCTYDLKRMFVHPISPTSHSVLHPILQCLHPISLHPISKFPTPDYPFPYTRFHHSLHTVCTPDFTKPLHTHTHTHTHIHTRAYTQREPGTELEI